MFPKPKGKTIGEYVREKRRQIKSFLATKAINPRKLSKHVDLFLMQKKRMVYNHSRSGYSAAWLPRLLRVQKIASSNLAIPTISEFNG